MTATLPLIGRWAALRASAAHRLAVAGVVRAVSGARAPFRRLFSDSFGCVGRCCATYASMRTILPRLGGVLATKSNVKSEQGAEMKVKTKVKAGRLTANHSTTVR